MTNTTLPTQEQTSRLNNFIVNAFSTALLVVAGFLTFVTLASA